MGCNPAATVRHFLQQALQDYRTLLDPHLEQAMAFRAEPEVAFAVFEQRGERDRFGPAGDDVREGASELGAEREPPGAALGVTIGDGRTSRREHAVRSPRQPA